MANQTEFRFVYAPQCCLVTSHFCRGVVVAYSNDPIHISCSTTLRHHHHFFNFFSFRMPKINKETKKNDEEEIEMRNNIHHPKKSNGK